MSLKLNIALTRKVGEPNYGSRGATVGLEMELESNLVDQPSQLHERIAELFRLAKHAVDRELSDATAAGAPHNSRNGTATAGQPAFRSATPAQVRAIHAIANRTNLDLTAELRKRFGVEFADDLSLEQASQLIDAIKTVSHGASCQSSAAAAG